MGLLIVNEDKCKQDGFCVQDCPFGIIAMPEDGYPQVIDGAEELCIRCGHCVAVCPFDALSHQDIALEKSLPIKKELKINAEQAGQFMRSRRSIRQYDPQPVEKADLETLIGMARFAQTGHNSQTVAWKVYTNPDDVRQIAGMVVDWMRMLVEKGEPMAQIMNMPVVIDNFDKGVDLIFRGAPHMALTHAHENDRFADHSCDIAATYVELYAPALGLGTCWAGFFERAAKTWPPLAEHLALPQGHVLKNAVMIGKPKVKYFRCPERKPLQITWA